MNLDLFGSGDTETPGTETPGTETPGTETPRHRDTEIIAIYADESCLGNGREGSNPGGAGGLIEMIGDSSAINRFDYWVSEPATTNNRMALRSVIEAFGELRKMNRQFRVVFTSDSKYIVEGMRSWVHGWVARGWRRKGGPIENLELWKQAVKAVAPFDTQWIWVRGHNGQPQNEYANHLATRAAALQSNSNGLMKSDFEQWLEDARKANNGFAETAPFPEAGTFKPSKRVWTI